MLVRQHHRRLLHLTQALSMFVNCFSLYPCIVCIARCVSLECFVRVFVYVCPCIACLQAALRPQMFHFLRQRALLLLVLQVQFRRQRFKQALSFVSIAAECIVVSCALRLCMCVLALLACRQRFDHFDSRCSSSSASERCCFSSCKCNFTARASNRHCPS